MKRTFHNKLLLFVFVFSNSYSFSQVSWDGGGDGVNWSSKNNWSTNVIPTNSQTVTIASGYNITVDNAAVCASLIIGDNGSSNTSITISGNNSLNVTKAGGGTGDLSFNPNNKAKTFSLIVGAGTLTVAGALTSGNSGNKGSAITVSTGSASFTSVTAFTFPKGMDLTVTGSGTMSFTAAFTLGTATAAESSTITLQGNGSYTFSGLVTLSDATNIIQNNTTAGTFNFNGGLTLNAGGSSSFVTMAGTTANFAGNLTVTTTALTFNVTSSAVITGTSTITPTAAITFGDFGIASGGAATLAGNITVAGDWSNTGGTLTGGANTVTFTGANNIISGTSSTSFPAITIAATAAYTMNNSNTCSSLTFTAASTVGLGNTFTHGNGADLTVSGAVTLNQPVVVASAAWNINGGSATVGGIISFVGSGGAGQNLQIEITSGSLTANGSVKFDSNANDPGQVITVSGSGSATFNSTVITTGQTDLRDGTLSVTGSGSMTFTQYMDMRGGTISVGAMGTVNFNQTGATAFSLTNTSIPAFTTNSGSTINFNGNLTVVSPALVFAAGSNSVFTAASTVTPTSAITFGNVIINSGVTVTQAGNISVTGDWTNLGGTRAGNFTVTFNGTGTQTITKAGSTETFYSLTTNTTGPLTIESTSDVNITNTLTMTVGNINLNGRTLQLGVGAVATLVRAVGIMYSNTGTFKRYVQSGTAISSTAAPLYGLFPMGTSTDYRPVAINSSVNPTGSGYISVNHFDPPPPSYVIDVSYTDNEGAAIQRISTIVSRVSTSGGFAGGTYSISVTYTNLSSQGLLTDLKLETYTSSVMGSVGTTFATGGTVAAPVGNRSGLSGADLSNDFVIGTKDKSPTGTPIRQYYYSRKNGNWNDNSAGNATWSYTGGGAGASCDCIPVNDGYAVISDGQTVTINVVSIVDYVDIGNTATIDGTATFTVNKDLRTAGSGKFTPTAGSWTISRDAFLVGTGSCSWPAASTVTGNLSIGSGTILTMSGGAGLTVTGNLVVDGTLALGTSTLTFNGTAGKTISNTSAGSITGAGATVSITTANKTISSGSSLSIAPTFAISGALTVTNNGTVTITGNITGTVAGSTWTNAANSVLNTTGAILTTGTLNASAGPNTVNYNAAGNQTIKTPASSYYNLFCSVSGTKSMGASISVTNNVTIQDAAILDEVLDARDLSGAAALTMTGTSEFIVRNGTNNVTKPDLTGTYSLTGGTVTITSSHGGGANFCSVRAATYYNLNLNGSNKYSLASLSSITNNLIVAGSVYFNDNTPLSVGGATIYSSSGSSTLADVLTTGTYTLTAGVFNDGGKTITVTGSGWTKNGGTFTATGTTVFNGTAVQTIDGSTATTFKNLTINNSMAGSGGVTLNLAPAAATVVSGALTLTSGKIISTSTNLLTLTSAATSTSGSSISFVDGPMTKQSIPNAGSFIFPVGKGTAWRRLAISAVASGASDFTAEYFNTGYGSYGVNAPLNNVSYLEYWTITKAVAGTAAKATLYWEDATASGITDCPDLTLAHWNGATWDEYAGTASGTCSGAGTGTVLMNSTSTTFSPITFGSKSGVVNPLPVEFLSFNATPNGSVVEVNWLTAVEMNTDHFMVQRSQDGKDFRDVEKVDAAGNSSTVKKYSSVDPDPYPGVSYYRLKQVDNDGRFAYSDKVAVNFNGDNSISVYPSPSSGNFNVSISGKNGKEVLLIVHDVFGRESYSEVLMPITDNFIHAIDLSGKLSPGVYMVTASSDDRVLEKKIAIR